VMRLAVAALALCGCTRSKPAVTTTTTGGTRPTTTTTTTPPTDSTTPVSDDDACPAIQMKAPDSVPQGTKARVTANLIGGAGRPTFHWSLTAGTIVSGQGTASIQVDTAGLGGSGLTATVDLGGLPKVCATTSATAAFLVGP